MKQREDLTAAREVEVPTAAPGSLKQRGLCSRRGALGKAV